MHLSLMESVLFGLWCVNSAFTGVKQMPLLDYLDLGKHITKPFQLGNPRAIC